MPRILVTGSSDGLGLAAALDLIARGHEVILHARSAERAREARLEEKGAMAIVTGDLSRLTAVRDIAEQIARCGSPDAVIHNAGLFASGNPNRTPDGHLDVLAVNTLAPYALSALIEGPTRLVFLSSSMHLNQSDTLDDIGFERRPFEAERAYGETKLHVTALALALARRFPHLRSNAVDPGWVPTRMGGPAAPGDLRKGHETQVWLAAGEDGGCDLSGAYLHHRRTRNPNPLAVDPRYQDRLLERLETLTGIPIA